MAGEMPQPAFRLGRSPVAAVAWKGFGRRAPQDEGPQPPGITQHHQSVETRRAPRGRGDTPATQTPCP